VADQEESGAQKFRRALDEGNRLDYLRGISDRGVSTDHLMKESGIRQHPDATAREALEQIVREDYLRGLK